MWHTLKSRTIKLALLAPVATAALVEAERQLPVLRDTLGGWAYVLLSVAVSTAAAEIRRRTTGPLDQYRPPGG